MVPVTTNQKKSAPSLCCTSISLRPGRYGRSTGGIEVCVEIPGPSGTTSSSRDVDAAPAPAPTPALRESGEKSTVTVARGGTAGGEARPLWRSIMMVLSWTWQSQNPPGFWGGKIRFFRENMLESLLREFVRTTTEFRAVRMHNGLW